MDAVITGHCITRCTPYRIFQPKLYHRNLQQQLNMVDPEGFEPSQIGGTRSLPASLLCLGKRARRQTTFQKPLAASSTVRHTTFVVCVDRSFGTMHRQTITQFLSPTRLLCTPINHRFKVWHFLANEPIFDRLEI